MISDHLNQGMSKCRLTFICATLKFNSLEIISIHEDDTKLGPGIMELELAWLDVIYEMLNRLHSLMLSQFERKEEENMALREQIDFLKGLLEECHEQEKAGHHGCL
jgi:hypothetical protein